MQQAQKTYDIGIDIGSTTMKIAVLDMDGHLVFSAYKRHHAAIPQTAASIIEIRYILVAMAISSLRSHSSVK